MKLARYGLVFLCLLSSPMMGQQNNQGTQNPLVDGKLIYVGKMPENLDAWVVNDLSVWGKYKPTRQIEGVDLVMKAYQPETKVQYKLRKGIPQPKEVPKDRDRKNVRFSIIVDDWVTGQQVWQADIVDQKQKRAENIAPSTDVKINARGLSSQQIAQAITRELRRYVDHLSSQQGVH
ncbi:MAG: hypothetical protein EPN47_01545 [Acidobacteria bacterium]|nr:MAG: hypothetical protein EPN47_01545 [Acidobacteriota bacterium]